MIQTGVGILTFYLKHPSVVFRHTKRAVSIARTQGITRLLELARSKIVSRDQELVKQRAEQKALEALRALGVSRKKNVDALLSALTQHAVDLSVLDIVHDSEERLKLVTRHILGKYHLLDESFYKRTYLEDINSITPADHYMHYGLPNGLHPNPYFDPIEYLIANPDVSLAGMDPVVHYALFGWSEGRSAGSLFDGDFYVAANPDVAQSGISPFIHFLTIGRDERRSPLRHGLGAGGLSTTNLPRTSGTIILVSHDAELGGAQQVVRILAKWLLSATRYEIKLVTMRGGPFVHEFSAIAPTFEVSAHSKELVADKLKLFAGENVKAIFVNSVASGGFLTHWKQSTPVVAFIHELPKLLRHFKNDLDLITQRASLIVGGSEAVRIALHQEFGVDESRLRTVYAFIEEFRSEKIVKFDQKQAARQSIGIDPRNFLVTACGVLHWRKSPQKFIEVAEKFFAITNMPAQFIWIGGGPDLQHCERLVVEKGLTGRVHFTGYEPEIARYLEASDLFLLPSEEDPFPLVCLYAAIALNPIVCFQEAGGIPEFVGKGCGRAVPFGDTNAMAEAVVDYIQNREMRERQGLCGRSLVQSEYTISTTGPQLLHHLRHAAGLKPHASVIVPNFNYDRFLKDRLGSISRQTFQDFEVILLDDCSSDDSVTTLTEWARKRPGTRLIVNGSNSGSPFAQWIRGMRLALSELVWIAEADDSCEPDLLETILPYFDDRNVFLGYVKSAPVDESGQVQGDYESLYLNRIARGRWSSPYIATDHEEANEGLGIANCIPNASSVVFRRFDPEPEFEKAVTNMRMCGDWLFYLRSMRGGLVAYNHRPLNLHRRHGATVTSKTEGSRRYFDESATVRSYIDRTYRLSQQARKKVDVFINQDLDRFGVRDATERQRILTPSVGGKARTLPSILIVASDLSPGGGQIFAIRLASAWIRHGGRAVLLNARKYPDHEKVLAQVDPRTALFHADDEYMSFRDLIERFDLDLVHSSLWWADRYVQEQIQSMSDLPWVITMHGCYETLIDNPAIDISFKGRSSGLLARVDSWVHTADKNRRFFSIYGRPNENLRINNGVETKSGNGLARKDLGLRPSSTVLCVATRAIKEKGWLEAIEIAKRLNDMGHEVDLMLIGEGPIADEVRANSPREYVHLYGQVENLHDYLMAADIGILPSYFGGESMPLVLLEMMAQGKPVVATDIGEIPSIIGSQANAGGVIVPLKRGRIDIETFVTGIESLLDPIRRKIMGKRAKEQFVANYTIEKMVVNYEKLYRSLLAKSGVKREEKIE